MTRITGSRPTDAVLALSVVCLMALPACLHNITFGHPALTQRFDVPEVLEVCPSAAILYPEAQKWAQTYKALGCSVPKVALGPCPARPEPGHVQLRSCLDLADGPFRRGCQETVYDQEADAVGIDRNRNAGVAYVDVLDHAPGRIGHVMGHVIGLADSTAGTSVMHPDARWTSTALVVCE